MIGANVLLGEVVRNKLTGLVQKLNASDDTFTASLPEVKKISTAPVDPLADCLKPGNIRLDDPNMLYRIGITSRDAGRFSAMFPSRDVAKQFVQQSRELIESDLIGIDYQIECTDAEVLTEPSTLGIQSVRLPQLEICQDSGSDVASHRLEYSDEERRLVSADVKRRHERGQDKKQTGDIAGLLESVLPLNGLRNARDLNELAGKSGYLALICADGNRVGERIQQRRDNFDPGNPVDPAKREAHLEEFFWSMRRALRRAVVDALSGVFKDADDKKTNGTKPYRLLMLGGDDVLLICQPAYAFDFVVALSNEIEKYSLPDGKPLGLGIGVAIGHCNLPFYVLEDTADQLLGSAKELLPRLGRNDVSVVDWLVTTASTVEPIAARRRKESVTLTGGKTYIKTVRPYPVLDTAVDDDIWHCQSFEQLLKDATDVRSQIAATDDSSASRAKLKRLLDQYQSGVQSVDPYYQRFYSGDNAGANENVHRLLEEQKHLSVADDTTDAPSVWRSFDQSLCYSTLPDLIDLVEVSYLGRNSPQFPAEIEPAVQHDSAGASS